MANKLLTGLSSLLLPLGLYAGPAQSSASYQRSYFSASTHAASSVLDIPTSAAKIARDFVATDADSLDIVGAHVAHELVIIDAAVPDKQQFYRAVKPGVDIVEINSSAAGLAQLKSILANYKNLAAVHIVSHAQAGSLQLGNSQITAETLKAEVETFAALNGAVREGGDLLLYGCDLASIEAGEELLDIVQRNTHLDVAASNDLTGNIQQQGDWDLEIQRGNIEAELAFSEKALKDFSGVLATYNLSSFTYHWTGARVAGHCPDNSPSQTYDYTSLSNVSYIVCGFMGNNAYGGTSVNIANYYGVGSVNAFLSPTGAATGQQTNTGTNHIEVRRSSGVFQLSSVVAAESFGGANTFSNVKVIGYVSGGGTVESTAITSDSAAANTFTFSGGSMSAFVGVNLTKFRLAFVNQGGSHIGYLTLQSFDATQDSTPPTISSVNSSTTNGTYKVGDVISVQVNFSENVTVASGTPQLTLETGTTDRTINYASGSGTSTLNFSYTVQAGDTAADLDYVATNSLTLNGATIRDGASNNATLTLASPGAANSLGANKNIVIDGVAPTVSSVTASTANGSYKVGDVISIQVNFSETVTVTGTPQLTLETGTTDRTINYASGSGSSTLTFSYTIQAGDTSSDLDYVATNSLALNGGSISDGAGNGATLTLASPGAANSLGNNKALVVDGVAPSVTSTAPVGGAATDVSVDFTVNFSESVSNISTDDFALGTTGSATGTIASVSASSGSSVTVTVSGITGNGTIKVNLNGSTNITDAVGNAAPAAYTSGTTHTVAIPTAPDAPTIGTATAGDGQVDVTFTAPGSNGGSAITTYTATANPGGATGNCAGPAACTITVSSLTNGTAYTFTVTATNAIGTSTASVASNSATPKANQTITFANPGAQNFGTTPTLSATATSGLTVSFTSSTTGVCTITSGGALTFVTAGTCTIDADQAGNGATNAAPTVSRTFTVNAIVPGAPTIGTATAGDTQASVTFTAPASTGGAAITGYTVTSNPGGFTGTGAGSPITVTGLTNGVSYTFTVTATNSAGTGAASGASNSITPASPQTITFANPGAQTYGTSPTLTATSDSGLTPTFTSSTTGVCTITSGGVLTFVTAGTCTINADQAGDSSYLPATQVSRSFTVNPAVPGAPTIGTAVAGDTQASVAFTAPVNTGGTTITGYTVTVSPPHVAPVNGASSPIVVNGLTNGQAYTFTVTADNAAGTGPASGASNSITPAATQTITFNNPGAQNFGTTPTLTATSDSGLTPTFTSSTTGVCTITSGGALTFVTAGTCTINADQAGNGSYLAAPQVSRSFTVNAVVPGAPTIGTATAGNTQATVAFTAPVSNGGAAITGYTVTANPGGATQAGAGSPITFTGLTNGTSYTFTVTATNSAGTGAATAASNAVTPKGTQTITFTAPAAQLVGAALTVSATASSGLTPTFTSSTTGVCTVTSGGVVTLIAAGTCTLTANQSGNAAYLAAPAVGRSFAVNPVNSAPLITLGSSVGITMSEDGSPTPFILVLDATDAESDPLTWSISAPAQQGNASVSDGDVSYVPAANYHGSDNFVVTVSDGSLSASITVNVTVTSVNDAPAISGSPVTSLDQDTAYSFTPTASDLDTGDVLTFSITNKPTWASFNTATGALTGTPAGTDTGKTIGIVISVNDGTDTTALPAFDIEVLSTIDPLQPIVTPPAELNLDATALFTPITLRQLLGLAETASQADVNAAIKLLAADGVTGNDCCTTTAEGLTATSNLLLAPGRHEIKWKATNAVGVSGEAVQVVNIWPLVSLSKSQVAVRGSEIEFRVLLNGPSPVYPFTVPYVINTTETTATAAEHNLVNGTVTFTQAGQLEAVVPVTLSAVTGFSDSILVVALGTGINAGAASHHVIEIRQGNVPPVVNLSITQGGINTSLVSPSGGSVTVTATVADANKADTHTFDWSATSGLADTDGNPTNASRTFDPAGLSGSHQLKVTVADSAGASVQATAYFRVVSTLPVLDVNTDTDKDGINDNLEGTGDTDDNGIPDYLDNMPSTNILPQQSNTTNAYLIECDPGVRCGLGLFARSGNSGGVQILDQEIGTLDDLVIDPAFEPVGGVFDFAIRDLPTPGQSVRVVIPQRSAIPANAVYRKYQRGRWVTFIADADNAVHSAAGNPGYCPPPGSADWTPGLTAGHMCVQLTIEDGGPNDDDGLVNSAVVDPGAVSEAKVVEPPEPPKPPVQVNSKGSGSMGGLWIVLLGGLLMFRRIKHCHWLALVALLCGQSQAQQLEDFYLRADVFSAESTQEEDDFNSALTGAGHEFSISKYDADRTGFQLAIGYHWNNVTYTQLGYLDLGDVQVDLLLDGDTDQQAFAADLAAEYPITATGATLVQGLKFGFGDHFNIGFEAGVYLWEGEVDVSGVPFPIAEDSGSDPLAGVLLDLPLGDHFTLGVGLRRVFFDEQEVNLYSFGSSYHF